MAAFDWYQATVRRDLDEVRQAVASMAEYRVSFEPMPKAPHGYGGGFRVFDGDHLYAQIWAGGTHAYPHCLFTGGDATRGAHLLRSEFPDDHLPSRIDSAEDFADPGAFDRIQPVALGVARDRKLTVDTRGDHLLTMQGRTVYLGSTKSAVRVRLYDKAAELRAKFRNDPVRLAEVPEELARLEVQVRPQTHQARQIAARMEPVQAFGSANWTRELMRQVAGLELEPVNLGKAWRQSDDERAYGALLAQYGGLLKRVCGDLGGWDMVGRQIGHDLAERDRHAKR